jgi:ABC transport system ATP-binding/permease protein
VVKKKLSYNEAREFATIEERIAKAEETLEQKRAATEDPKIATDSQRLLTAHSEMEEAQKTVDRLYARWAELEAKKS